MKLHLLNITLGLLNIGFAFYNRDGSSLFIGVFCLLIGLIGLGVI